MRERGIPRISQIIKDRGALKALSELGMTPRGDYQEGDL